MLHNKLNIIFLGFLIFNTISYVHAQAGNAAQNAEVKTLIIQASKECRKARALRRDSLDDARAAFNEYEKLLAKANAIVPSIASSNDPTIKRAMSLCNKVSADLDRGEALYLYDSAIQACDDSKIALANGDFEAASASFKRFSEQRTNALELSPSVSDTYGSYETNVCLGLESEIAQAEREYREELRNAANESQLQQQVSVLIEWYSDAQRQCQGAENLLKANTFNKVIQTQVKKIHYSSQELLASAEKEEEKLTAQGVKLDNKNKSKIVALKKDINRCIAAVPTKLDKRIAEEAVRKPLLPPKKSPKKSLGKPLKTGRIESEYKQIVGAPAKYPKKALQKNIQGEVHVSFTVDINGDVTDIKVLESKPEGVFDKAVIRAVRKYKYQPRIVDGDPVEVTGVTKIVKFKFN